MSIAFNFTAYHTKKFSIEDYIKLAEVTLKLSLQQNIQVLILNHNIDLTRQRYE
nr:hypothetical protein [Candidatus Profftia sp. (ex Adelges kitamiensis)]